MTTTRRLLAPCSTAVCSSPPSTSLTGPRPDDPRPNGTGPAVFGVFVARTGYPAAFALTGLLILAALEPALRDRRAARPGAA